MYRTRYAAILCVTIFVLGQAAALPQHPQQHRQLQQRVREDKKFVAKPNATKKVVAVADDRVDDNRIEESDNDGFSWSNVLGLVKRVLLGKGASTDPSKTEIESPWKSMVTIALKLITAVIGGPRYAGVEGTDKEKNENPLQFTTLAMNLLDALRTSFSHRSLLARSSGRRDTISEVAAASIAMFKGYARSIESLESEAGPNRLKNEIGSKRNCVERALCEASAECVADAQNNSSIFCQLGSYATSYLLQKQSGLGFEALHEAGRRGRNGGNCVALFASCEAA